MHVKSKHFVQYSMVKIDLEKLQFFKKEQFRFTLRWRQN